MCMLLHSNSQRRSLAGVTIDEEPSSSREPVRCAERLEANHSACCTQLIKELTQKELEELKAYARFRLIRAGLPRDLAEDMRQNALLAVLLGCRSDVSGRHPRKGDLADKSAFIRYLRGIICSLVEAQCRRQNRFTFVPLDLDLIGHSEPETKDRVAGEDLAQQLFRRLGQRAPEHLLPTLRQWAAQWRECSVIPLAGKHRRLRQELRVLAAKVLNEVSASNAIAKSENEIHRSL